MNFFNSSKSAAEEAPEPGTGEGRELSPREIEKVLIAAGASHSFAKKVVSDYRLNLNDDEQRQNRLKAFREKLRG